MHAKSWANAEASLKARGKDYTDGDIVAEHKRLHDLEQREKAEPVIKKLDSVIDKYVESPVAIEPEPPKKPKLWKR